MRKPTQAPRSVASTVPPPATGPAEDPTSLIGESVPVTGDDLPVEDGEQPSVPPSEAVQSEASPDVAQDTGEDEGDFVEIILTVSLAGAECKAPGDVHRCSPAEAERMRDAGFARPEA